MVRGQKQKDASTVERSKDGVTVNASNCYFITLVEVLEAGTTVRKLFLPQSSKLHAPVGWMLPKVELQHRKQSRDCLRC